MNFLMYPIWYLAYHYLGKSKVTIPQAFLGILVGNAEIYQAYSNALWFVLVLMLAKILYVCLIKLAKEREEVMLTSMILCAAVPYFYLIGAGGFDLSDKTTLLLGIIGLGLGSGLLTFGGAKCCTKIKKKKGIIK